MTGGGDDGPNGPALPHPLIRVIHSSPLHYNADCAEFCPVPGLTHLLALGTYQLMEAEQRRVGRCYLYCLQGEGGKPADGRGGAAAPTTCSEACAVDVPGIFDIKWAPAAAAAAVACLEGDGRGVAAVAAGRCGQPRALLGAALADGTVRLLEATLEEEGAGGESRPRPRLRQSSEVAACSSGMALSLDWQAGASSDDVRIASSSSAGTLSVTQVTNTGLTLISEWEAHSLEVWCAAWHRAEGHLLFSGADDCCFKAFDIRSDLASSVFCNRRTHTAGVCTVSPHPIDHNLVATGSYDESVRLWDVRNMARPVVQAEVNTGGGNWRVRWHRHDPRVMLVACMYNGFAVLRSDEAHSALEVVVNYQSPNKHIGYGVDWWQAPAEQQQAAAEEEAERAGAAAAAVAEEAEEVEGAGAEPQQAAAEEDEAARQAAEQQRQEAGAVAAVAGAAVAELKQEVGAAAAGAVAAAGGRCSLAATCSFYDSLHTLVWLPTT